MLEAVEHGVAEPDEVVHVGEESAAGPLAAVVHVGRVAQPVLLVAHVIPDDDHGSLHSFEFKIQLCDFNKRIILKLRGSRTIYICRV